MLAGNSIGDGTTQHATAEYLADLILELQRLADASGQYELARLLDLAHLEARRNQSET